MFRNMEMSLGNNAKMAFSFFLLDPNNQLIGEEHYNGNLPMPLASTRKTAIALTVYKQVLDDQLLNFDTQLALGDKDISLGMTSGPLDKLFYQAGPVNVTVTVKELLENMLIFSDNTSTDNLVELIGGIENVNQLMHQLGIHGYQSNRTATQLLSAYFALASEKTILNAENCTLAFKTALVMRDIEATIFSNNKDTCPVASMSNLIKLLITNANSENDNWLSTAAREICNIMARCETGPNMIKKAVQPYQHRCAQFGHKTGGIGGVRNDAAFLTLDNGYKVILTIYTCMSPLEVTARETFIANLASDILAANFAKHRIELTPTKEKDHYTVR